MCASDVRGVYGTRGYAESRKRRKWFRKRDKVELQGAERRREEMRLRRQGIRLR